MRLELRRNRTEWWRPTPEQPTPPAWSIELPPTMPIFEVLALMREFGGACEFEATRILLVPSQPWLKAPIPTAERLAGFYEGTASPWVMVNAQTGEQIMPADLAAWLSSPPGSPL